MTTQAQKQEVSGPEGLIFLPGIDPIEVGTNPERQLSNLEFAITVGRGAFKGMDHHEQQACLDSLRNQSVLYLGERALVVSAEL